MWLRSVHEAQACAFPRIWVSPSVSLDDRRSHAPHVPCLPRKLRDRRTHRRNEIQEDDVPVLHTRGDEPEAASRLEEVPSGEKVRVSFFFLTRETRLLRSPQAR